MFRNVVASWINGPQTPRSSTSLACSTLDPGCGIVRLKKWSRRERVDVNPANWAAWCLAVVYVQALEILRKQTCDANLCSTVDADAASPCWCAPSAALRHTAPADDEATMVEPSIPFDVIERVGRGTEIVTEAFSDFGLK